MTHPSVASDTSPSLGEEFLGLKEWEGLKVLKGIMVFGEGFSFLYIINMVGVKKVL